MRTKRATSGRLRNSVTIKRNTPSTAADGQVVESMTAFANEWCEVLSVGGGERVRGVQIEAGIDTVVAMRFRSDLDPTMQIVHDGRALNIVRASDPDGTRRELIVQCKELVS